MSRKLRVGTFLLGLILAVAIVLWYPYESGIVPEWKLQVVDQSGQTVVGAQVSQQWLDPIDDGIVSVDSRTSDARGVVLFPKPVLHNRLALGTVRSAPSSRIEVCWHDQYGDVGWDGKPPQLPPQLVLKKGSCPYG
jgi:hypothetical protein